MNYKQLKNHASSCQIEADKMAYNLINQNAIFQSISVFQGRCGFNLFWLYQISPEILIHEYTIHFLADNINNFTRDITLKEMIQFDGVIFHNKPKTFNEFKKII